MYCDFLIMIKFLDKYSFAQYYEIIQKWEYSFIDNFILDSKIIVDGWSHLWFFSLYCAKLNILKLETIYLFEPIKIHLNYSKKLLNWTKPKKKFFNYAFSWKNWNSYVYFNLNKSCESSTNKFVLWCFGKKQNCNTINWNYFFKFFSEIKIDLFKIDIEWAEYDFLESFDLKYFKGIKSLILEYHVLNEKSLYKKMNLINKLSWIYKYIKYYPNQYSFKNWYLLFTN